MVCFSVHIVNPCDYNDSLAIPSNNSPPSYSRYRLHTRIICSCLPRCHGIPFLEVAAAEVDPPRKP